MNIESIITALEEEKNRIDGALSALGSQSAGRKKRKMSAAARKRISDAQKKRWASRKKK